MGNEIRLGKVSAIDYPAGMARVVYHEKDDSVTRLIPFLSDEYRMPEIGDQVLVIHLSNGQEAGVILGRPWSGKNKPPEGEKDLYRKDLARTPGEAMLRYKDGTLTIKAAKVVVDGDLEITGNLTVKGTITSQGDTVAAGTSVHNHTHGGDSGGTTTPPQ